MCRRETVMRRLKEKKKETEKKGTVPTASTRRKPKRKKKGGWAEEGNEAGHEPGFESTQKTWGKKATHQKGRAKKYSKDRRAKKWKNPSGRANFRINYKRGKGSCLTRTLNKALPPNKHREGLKQGGAKRGPERKMTGH